MAPDLQLVRQPAVAGSFYPAAPQQLATLVQGLLAGTQPGDGRSPKALIVPHAGLAYSGPIAATAYATVAPFADRISRVVLVGPSHRVPVEGLAAPGAHALRTPLGDVAVDLEALRALPDLAVDVGAHASEHSLEVQLPFLQLVLPGAKVVPLVAGHASTREVSELFEALWGGPETLIVVSSDLSHYLPYDEARAADRASAARILALEPDLEPDDACGHSAVNGLLAIARRKGLGARLLDLRSSGDTAGPRGEVVGYGAFAFFEEVEP